MKDVAGSVPEQDFFLRVRGGGGGEGREREKVSFWSEESRIRFRDRALTEIVIYTHAFIFRPLWRFIDFRER